MIPLALQKICKKKKRGGGGGGGVIGNGRYPMLETLLKTANPKKHK